MVATPLVALCIIELRSKKRAIIFAKTLADRYFNYNYFHLGAETIFTFVIKMLMSSEKRLNCI